MSRRLALPALILSAAALLTACASRPAPVAAVPVEQVSVHESVTSAPPRYQVLRRIWTEEWRSAVRVPGYATVEEGRDDVRRHAASLGANGVINFGCYRKVGASGNGTRLNCNGTAVKFL